MKSLLKQNHNLSDPEYQLAVLKESGIKLQTTFQKQLQEIQLFPLTVTQSEIFQVNMGKMCNQVCQHCHVDAGPDRKEIMTRETMQSCLDFLKGSSFTTVDLTGGAPEMNPEFRWFVEELSALGKKVIVRCNLTIILANKKYHDLPEFYKKHGVEVVSSLPFYNADKTDRQRGKGVFDDSIKALKMLNNVGYGMENSDLTLNLVYNPSGAFLPGGQKDLENKFKTVLADEFGVYFNQLFAITNMPISRYLEFLLRTDNFEAYMEKLINAFNPAAAKGVMCRNTLSIGWDGYLYDCDFNQMLEMKIDTPYQHISNVTQQALNLRNIRVNQHCFGCTAGAGSSCGGNTV